MRRNIALLLGALFLIVAILLYQILVQPGALSRNISAREQRLSAENSYVFVSPLRAKADGVEKIRTTVFLIDTQGAGIQNVKIELEANQSIDATSVQNISDEAGRAVFDLSSKTPGEYYLNVYASKQKLGRQAHLVFD